MLCLTAFIPPAEPVKRALIVAIGDYPEVNGWGKINSTKDVPYMQKLLLSQGFLNENIALLQDSQATYLGIEQALRSLNEACKPGDVVVIHISAHGEQIEDDNGDEVDGFDESIVTWGALSPRMSKDFQKDQALYLRDDKFGEMIDNLRRRLGAKGDVVVFMDACHSGTGTRGQMKVRGGQPPMISGAVTSRKPGKDTAGVFAEKRKTSAEGMASYIVVAAARAEELNAETVNENGEGMGSLTFALSQVFESLDSGATYRSMFAGVQSVMNQIVRGQHPVLEGTAIDRRLFGGSYVAQKPYAEIEQIENSKQIYISDGQFAGFDEGAMVLICKAGSKEPTPSNVLDTGIVISASYYNAYVKLKKGGLKNATDFWVFLSSPMYRIKLPTVILQKGTGGYTKSESDAIIKKLGEMNGWSTEGKADLILTKGKLRDSLKFASNGYLFETVSKELKPTEMADISSRFSRYLFLASLDVKDKKFNAEVRLIPVRNGKPDTNLLKEKFRNGTYEFRNGDTFVLHVTNLGSKAFYINVLDLQPDGRINPVFPNRGKKLYARDLQIGAGKTREFNNALIVLSPPLGEEVFKIFYSYKPLDLEMIATPPKGAGTKGNLSFMEQIVDRSVQNTKGEAISLQGNTEGAVGSIVFSILPRK